MMKLNIGLSRKIGEPNYGSRGASVNLELEVDGGLVRQPDELRKKIRYLFDLAKESVDEELNNGGRHDASTNENGRQTNGHQRSNGRHATASQCRALHAIANRARLDLNSELHSRFGVERPEDLSITEASELIDALKSTSNGNGSSR